MNFSCQRVSTSVLQTYKGGAYQTIEDHQDIGASKSRCVKVAIEELEDTEVWGEDVPGLPLLLEKEGLIGGQEFDRGEKGIDVAVSRQSPLRTRDQSYYALTRMKDQTFLVCDE